MDIEVGEWVRTNDGHIGKLKRIERDDIDISLKWYVFFDGKNERYINKPYIIKHSKNILDLIEVGDLIHKEVVWSTNNKKRIETVSSYYTEQDIKTILPHEQYERNCYRLEE